MSTNLHNLSSYNPDELPSADKLRFALVVSEWNPAITRALLEGAYQTLTSHGIPDANIIIRWVPGSFELPSVADLLIKAVKPDAVICLGCVIQGETRHFEFICQAVAQGITRVSLDNSIPVIFGVLTTNTLDQAKDRAGGKHGNKGIEAAVTAIKMAALKNDLAAFNE